MTKEMEERLNKANTLREEEKYGESSKIYTECLLELTELNDAEGLIHALSGQSLIYKHHVGKTEKSIYENLTLAFAYESFRVAEDNKDSLDGRVISIACKGLGDALIVKERYDEALVYFERAVEVTTADRCEKGTLKAHVGGVKYKLGKKEEGVKEILEALGDIRTGDMNTYAPRVWETGCLNKLAIASALDGKNDEALKYVTEAIQIEREHNLSIRLKESERILENINTGKTDFGV